jgi:MoxR-like ATPase
MESSEVQSKSLAMVSEIEKVIVGKRDTIFKAVLTLLCNGHLLLEDIPGVGKTTLAKSLAKVIGGKFGRVQFTPDLLPSDITGGSIYNQRESVFEFRPGPVFANILLADEINRATPKTQSSLLEAMEERQVTTDGDTRPLPKPFFVIATQNSIEMTGTYPLPEAQLDRFFARLSLGYPGRLEEADILSRQQTGTPLENIAEVVSPQELLEMQVAVRSIFVHDSVREYIVDVVRATRETNQLIMGASPRGSLLLMKAAQGHAAMNGHDFVRPDDVKAVASAVLSHRILSRTENRAKGLTTDSIVTSLMKDIPTPVPI